MVRQALVSLLEQAAEVVDQSQVQLRVFDSAALKYFRCLVFVKAKVGMSTDMVLSNTEPLQLAEPSAALPAHQANEMWPWPLSEMLQS